MFKKNRNLFIKILLIMSCPFFTMLLSGSCFFSFILAILLSNNIKIEKNINNKSLFIYIFVSCYFITSILSFSNQSIIKIHSILNNISINTISSIIGILSLPIAIFYCKLFHDFTYNKIINFFKNLSKNEKLYLLIVSIMATITSIVIINYTTLFTNPFYDCDILYTSDTGQLVNNDAYMNPSYSENDIRQPLFGVFSIPFSLSAKIISNTCFMCRSELRYPTVLTIIQFILLSISTIMLARLINISEDKKKYFYIFISLSFPYLLFSLLLEQYVIALFYLILTIYCYFKNPNKTNYIYVFSVGTIITSGILFPLIVKYKNFKQWFNSIFNCFQLFIIILAVSGQLSQIFGSFQLIKLLLNNFAKGLTFTDKLYQYSAFIKGLFFPNQGHIIFKNTIPTYQLLEYNSLNWIGIIILLLCIISFILNYKNKMAILSMLWIAFSAIILLFIGWGTVENGLILYSLYFAWAFYILIYLLIDKICKRKKIYLSIISILILVMFISNYYEFYNILKFAIKYYP